MTISPDLCERTILIVDDTPANLALAVAMLENHGLRMTVAQSGLEALRRAAFAVPDLILLDVMLPDIDGLEVCRRLKAEGGPLGAVPVIFMTALSETACKVAGFRSGAVDYVTKPLQAEEVLARVTSHLRLAAMQAQLAAQNALLAAENRERREAELTLQRYRDSLAQQVAERTAELRASESRFRTLCEHLPDPVVRYDRSLQRTYVNPALQQALLQRGAQVPMPDQDWCGNLPLAEYQAILQSVLDSGQMVEVNLCFNDRHGSAREMAVHFAAERGADGAVCGVVAIGRDITAQKRAERELATSHAQLRELGAYRESAREDERKRIARELHDELGQSLTALRMQAALLRVRHGAEVPGLSEQVSLMTELVDRTIGVVRSVATTLHPTALALGVGSALEWLVDEFRQHSGIDCSLTLALAGQPFSEAQAIAVFRIVQESLTNVARHADATETAVTLQCAAMQCRLQIDDNGRGFEPAQRRGNSFGLLAMRERVVSLDGQLAISSQVGGPTRITVTFPLEGGAAPANGTVTPDHQARGAQATWRCGD